MVDEKMLLGCKAPTLVVMGLRHATCEAEGAGHVLAGEALNLGRTKPVVNVPCLGHALVSARRLC